MAIWLSNAGLGEDAVSVVFNLQSHKDIGHGMNLIATWERPYPDTGFRLPSPGISPATMGSHPNPHRRFGWATCKKHLLHPRCPNIGVVRILYTRIPTLQGELGTSSQSEYP